MMMFWTKIGALWTTLISFCGTGCCGGTCC